MYNCMYYALEGFALLCFSDYQILCCSSLVWSNLSDT